jgi:hypothetical protein
MSEEKFSIILEDEPTLIGGVQKPVTRQLDFIEAENLDDAWDKARAKWYGHKFTMQIVDIIPGELTEPLRPSEAPQEITEPQEEPQEVTEPQEEQ